MLLFYGGILYVDGGVLDNVFVIMLVGKDGLLIVVNVVFGGNLSFVFGGYCCGKLWVFGLIDILLCIMIISSVMVLEKVLV